MARDGNGVKVTPPHPRHPLAATVVFLLFGGPAIVVAVVPWLLSGFRVRPPFLGWEPWRWIGVALIALGSGLVLDALARFVRQGRGTPSPVGQTEHLVVSGAYRFVRNPMYVAVIAILVGEALLLGSAAVLAWAAAVTALFAVWVRVYEEPRLRRLFGAEYEAFCRRVPRWFPRLGARG
ncbi:MAG TPA: isoprenylcysteine carboxylmethyltransferase family protein [Actinomycetota bacterium]|nr:isoprenylcysteine carboxylmethyltransferase family protein [Actinomycetota bacterium]